MIELTSGSTKARLITCEHLGLLAYRLSPSAILQSMIMSDNINTREYWDGRFGSGDWVLKGGRSQTTNFALAQIKLLRIPRDFCGSILDFGCGMGDAIPIYHEHFPNASLLGIDISPAAIGHCRKSFGKIASFLDGDHTLVPYVDVIIASNIFEHLSDDLVIARHLLTRCRQLHIVVPYREPIGYCHEHVNYYDRDSFNAVGTPRVHIFACRGYSYNDESYLSWWCRVYLKNMARACLGRRRVRPLLQASFTFGKV